MENTESKRESGKESEEEESSEADSPKKKLSISSRTARVDLKTPSFADLNKQLNNQKDDEKREFVSS